MGCMLIERLRQCWIKADNNDAIAPCILFGVIHTLAGIGVLAVAIWLYVDSSLYLHNSTDNYTYFTAIYILMGAGAIMTVVGFLGCCGALQESPCMLGTFFVLLLVIFTAEVTGGVWAWLHKEEVQDLISRQVSDMVKNYGYQDDKITKTIDAMQHDLQCCGGNDPGTWSQSVYNNKGGMHTPDIGVSADSTSKTTYQVPTTCCEKDADCEQDRTLQYAANDFKGIHKLGCVPRLKQYLRDHLNVIIGIGIGVGIVQILGLIFSIVLCCAIRNEEAEIFKA